MKVNLAEIDQLNEELKEKNNGETLLHIALKFEKIPMNSLKNT